MGSFGPLKERFTKLKETDNDREKLVEDILSKAEKLEKDLAATEARLRHANDLVTMYDMRFIETKAELVKAGQVMNSNKYVAVLIDGDCMPFHDELVKNGQTGGQEAARTLRAAVKEHIISQSSDLHDAEVHIRAYANLKGLSKAYSDNKILETAAQFGSFVRGFNMGHPLCDYVDAGEGKECSDEKLKADIHCKYVVFGGSADNGYARLLGPYSHEDDVRKRITMLEGPPFERELAALTDRFAVTSFPNLFRDSKLPNRRVSFTQATTTPISPGPNASTYAHLVSQSVRTPNVPSPGLAQGQDMALRLSGRRTESRVLKNSKGQRIDSIISPNESIVNTQKAQKMCNQHHLNGFCSTGAQGFKCQFSHAKLSEAQIEAQRYIARLMACDFGLECEDEKCYFGHHCPRPICRLGDSCRFSREMHNVSRE